MPFVPLKRVRVYEPEKAGGNEGKSDSLVSGLRLKAMIEGKGTHKRKVTLARVRQLPMWLRRLDQVKAELKGTRFPRTADEGFRQCAALSTTALRWLRDSIRGSFPNASEEQLETEKRCLLARLSAAECRWLAVWRK